MSTPTITRDLSRIGAWFGERHHTDLVPRVWASMRFGPPDSESVVVTPQIDGRILEFAIRQTVFDRRGVGEDVRIRFEVTEAALWPTACTMTGKLDLNTFPPSQAKHCRRFLRKEYRRDRADGFWYPDLEVVAAGHGFVSAVPVVAPSLSTWLPASPSQYPGGSGVRGLQRLFEAEVRRLRDGGLSKATLPAAGVEFARRGGRRTVQEAIDPLLDELPDALLVDAWLRFLSDHDAASRDYERAVRQLAAMPYMRGIDKPLLSMWRNDRQQAANLGLLG